ncbi:MAG: ribokinase [Eubacteriales bacterium]
MNKITVLGSMNMDIVYRVKKAPKDGETIFGTSLEYICGGKGANQAVAAKRLGADVSMIGKVGADSNGIILTEALQKDGINTDLVTLDENESTGTAIISVNESGSNSIVVISGSNMKINRDDITKSEKEILSSQFLLTQLEVPMEAISIAFDYARINGVKTILNPAPASSISDEILANTDIIIPNETEAYILTKVCVEDISSAKEAAEVFFRKGVGYVIITLGEKGAALVSRDKAEIIPAFPVQAIDTTAAGDGFVGALSSSLPYDFKYDDLRKAVIFGNKVSSIVVQRKGAQPSLPYLNEINRIYQGE